MYLLKVAFFYFIAIFRFQNISHIYDIHLHIFITQFENPVLNRFMQKEFIILFLSIIILPFGLIWVLHLKDPSTLYYPLPSPRIPPLPFFISHLKNPHLHCISPSQYTSPSKESPPTLYFPLPIHLPL